MTLRNILLALVTMFTLNSGAQGNTTANEARRTFEKAYNLVFGPQGCTLHYDVNLVGVYKTAGTIWYKGKKNKFIDSRVDSWCDGTTMYTVFRKRKVIEVNDPNSDKRDKYSSKFKFTLDDFDYSMERTRNDILISLKQRRGARGTVKHAKVLLDGTTLAPKLAKVKVALFWATIHISDFRSGGIRDDIFVFPRQNYGSEYRYEDNR